MEVYIDLYFLVNAGMDLLCLCMTAAILHRPAKRWRLLLAALLGGLYASCVLLFGINEKLSVVLDLLTAILLVAVALSQRNGSVLRLFQNTGVYTLLSALLGGVMTILYRFLNRLDLPLETLEGDGLSAWMFALLAAIAGFFTVRGGRLFRRSAATKTVELEITIEQKTVRLCALVDSGNFLTDPISGRSVILADSAKLSPYLPPQLQSALKHPASAQAEYAKRIRLIPTKTATGEGMLAAFAPDRLVIVTGKERTEGNDLVAPTPLGESANGCDAIISSE